MNKRAALLGIVAVLALATMTACEPPIPEDDSQPPSNGRKVLVLGDSLTAEVKSSPDGSGWLGRLSVDWAGAKYGSSPCNGGSTLDSLTYSPDVIVIAYSGNNGFMANNCMNGETGKALQDRYAGDIDAIIMKAKSMNARVAVITPPDRAGVSDLSGLRTRIKRTASFRGVPWFEGGNLLFGTSPSAACSTVDTVCGTAGSGRNGIRNSDRIHFCPTKAPTIFGACDSYSSGAVRYGYTMAFAIDRSKRPS